MKKSTLGATVLTAMMLFSPITGDFAEASTQTTKQSTQKVMWGKSEVSQTQIGRIVFLTGVKLYKRGADGELSFHLNAKKGSMWRVHNIIKESNGYYYDLGGGVRVKQSNLSKYERVPSDLAKKMVERYGAKIIWKNSRDLRPSYPRFSYPQVSRLVSKDVEDKINEIIESNALNNAMPYTGAMIKSDDLKVVENANNRLKVTQVIEGYDVEGEGYATELDRTSYHKNTNVYNLTTGELIDGYWETVDASGEVLVDENGEALRETYRLNGINVFEN